VSATQLVAQSFSGCLHLQGRACAPERGAGGCAAAVRGDRARGARHRHGCAPRCATGPGLPADAAAHAKCASACSVWLGQGGHHARMAPLLGVAAARKQGAYRPPRPLLRIGQAPTLPYSIPHQPPLACGRCAAVRGHAQPVASGRRVCAARTRAACQAARMGRHCERLECLVRTAARGRSCPHPTLSPTNAARQGVQVTASACQPCRRSGWRSAALPVGSTLGAVPASNEPKGSSQPPPHGPWGHTSKDALERRGIALTMAWSGALDKRVGHGLGEQPRR